MKIEQAVLVKILPTKVWIESSIFGERAVMVQHEGYEPFEYAVFNYDYRYTSNSGTWGAAEAMARQLGATDPIEHRNRIPVMPTADDLRQQIAALTEALDSMEKVSPNAGNERSPD